MKLRVDIVDAKLNSATTDITPYLVLQEVEIALPIRAMARDDRELDVAIAPKTLSVFANLPAHLIETLLERTTKPKRDVDNLLLSRVFKLVQLPVLITERRDVVLPSCVKFSTLALLMRVSDRIDNVEPAWKYSIIDAFNTDPCAVSPSTDRPERHFRNERIEIEDPIGV